MKESNEKPRIALFGLGLLGIGMASVLLDGGFPLTIYNRTKKKAVPFQKRGATIADTPREAAADAELLISVVADDDASRKVWNGEDGALAGVSPGSILIEVSTLSASWIKELGTRAAERGCSLLDAPVTGSRDQAAAGQLCFLVGGDEAVLNRARPILECMSRAILYLGPQGSGCMMKLINNFLCGVHAASLAEAIAMIEHSGLDKEAARSMLESGAPASPLVKIVYDRMTKRDYEANFHLALMVKDLSYACKEGERYGVKLKTGAAALERFSEAKEAGYALKDFAAVVEPLRNA